ncbi:hypothetical protein FQR65_LT20776 [Abscondita terminalis]|nr:hypothetical protein FQR65_LT20776 [Abscondita terminalis]
MSRLALCQQSQIPLADLISPWQVWVKINSYGEHVVLANLGRHGQGPKHHRHAHRLVQHGQRAGHAQRRSGWPEFGFGAESRGAREKIFDWVKAGWYGVFASQCLKLILMGNVQQAAFLEVSAREPARPLVALRANPPGMDRPGKPARLAVNGW